MEDMESGIEATKVVPSCLQHTSNGHTPNGVKPISYQRHPLWPQRHTKWHLRHGHWSQKLSRATKTPKGIQGTSRYFQWPPRHSLCDPQYTLWPPSHSLCHPNCVQCPPSNLQGTFIILQDTPSAILNTPSDILSDILKWHLRHSHSTM